MNEIVVSKPMYMETLNDVQSIGEILAKSGFFQDSRDAARAITKILAGQEMGFGPVASMTGIHIVQGNVTVGATLMAAAVKRSGRYNYRIKEHTHERCTIEFYENGKAIGVSTYTIEEARNAGLAGKDNWKKYPDNMLFARAMSNGVKWHTPDVFGGPVYTADELGAVVDGATGEIIEAEVRQEPTRQVSTSDNAGPPKSNGNGHRPLHALKLQEYMHKKLEGASDEPASDSQRNLVRMKGDELFVDDDAAEQKRHSLLAFFFGSDSTKTLTKAQASAFLDWALQKNDPDYALHDAAPEEAARVIRHVMLAAGQADMFDTDEEQSD